MSKWILYSLLALFVPLTFGQWTPAPANSPPQANYPQSQYPAASQDQSDADTPDPADLQHGVARISIVQGDVNVRRGDNNQVTGAVVNAPLLAHDHLETSQGSRAEVQLDAGTILRLSPNTDLGFADLQYRRAQVQIGLGTLIFRVLPNAATQVEIDTPSVGMHALTQGEYRISVLDDGTSQVTVRSGQLELSGVRGSEQINAGQTVLIRGDASDPEMQQPTAEIARDQFDEWSEQRDGAAAAPQSAQYVNADLQGAAELDQYGSWVPSGYGQAWRPQGVASDWSPYSNGQWSYVDYYGWSWIDYSPWGWAPYHYGRWFWNTGYGWCWWPGARGYHSYWSPALVGFFGFGGRGGIGFGNLGWVALGPYERYHRWWGAGGGYGFRGGGFNFASYRNAGVRGGVMTAGYNGFGGPHQRFVAANRGQLAGATGFNGRLPFSPTREGYNYSARHAVVNDRLASAGTRSFYHPNQQVTPRPSFSRPSTPAYPSSRVGGSSASGWQHFGNGGSGASTPRQNYQNSEASGWHTFGKGPMPRYSSPSYQQQPRSTYQPSVPRQSYQQQPRSTYQPSAPRQSYQPQPRSTYQPSAPQQNYSRPNYSAPRQAQPRSEPHYNAPSAPRGGGGGGNGGGGSHGGGNGGGHHGR